MVNVRQRWRNRLRVEYRNMLLGALEKALETDDSFDLYEALGSSREAKMSLSLCFRCYHKRAVELFDEDFREDQDSWEFEEFWRLAVAFAVLSDDDRKDVYDRCGYNGLRASERHNAVDAFELDAVQIFDDFFDCKHPITRQHHPQLKEYLLLEAGSLKDDD